MNDETPNAPDFEQNKQPSRALTFNEDGTIDPEQLVGLAPDLVAKIISPEFIARAREGIAADKARISFQAGARQIRDAAQTMHIVRRPAGVSGRQRKKLRKLARKVAMLRSISKQEGVSNGSDRELPDHQSS